MPTATLTSKGQITIPINVRRALGLKPGVRIDFYETADGEYALRPRTASIMDLEGCLAYDGSPIAIENMNQEILDRAAELDSATRSKHIENKSDGETA